MVVTHFFPVLRAAQAGAVALLLALAGGCTYAHGDSAPVPCDTAAQTVTYAGVISPIFDVHCRRCHASDKANTLGGGNNFGSYQDIRQYPPATLLGVIRHEPRQSPMPKGAAKIPECDILRIQAWIDAGQPNN